MAITKGSLGKLVSYEVRGINKVIASIAKQKNNIIKGVDFGVVRAGAFVEEETKASIGGQRAEPKSVATGKFIKSVNFEKGGYAEGVVKPKEVRYPKSDVTTVDVAGFMEKLRGHFKNTESRTKKDVKKIIKKEVDMAISKS